MVLIPRGVTADASRSATARSGVAESEPHDEFGATSPVGVHQAPDGRGGPSRRWETAEPGRAKGFIEQGFLVHGRTSGFEAGIGLSRSADMRSAGSGPRRTPSPPFTGTMI